MLAESKSVGKVGDMDTEWDCVVVGGGAATDATQHGQLTAAGVVVDEQPVAEFVAAAGELTTIAFADGSRLARRGVLVASSMHQRSRLAADLGVATAPPNPVAEDAIKVDAFHRTSVPGVFAAGDLSAQMPQVAAAVVQSLLADQFGLPVPPWPIEKEDADAHA